MLKKRIMGLTIATILIAYISAIALSNQVFAQVHPAMPGTEGLPLQVTDAVTQANVKVLGEQAEIGKILAGHEAQLGQVLGSHPGLGTIVPTDNGQPSGIPPAEGPFFQVGK